QVLHPAVIGSTLAEQIRRPVFACVPCRFEQERHVGICGVSHPLIHSGIVISSLTQCPTTRRFFSFRYCSPMAAPHREALWQENHVTNNICQVANPLIVGLWLI